jgi:hypothetical protein
MKKLIEPAETKLALSQQICLYCTRQAHEIFILWSLLVLTPHRQQMSAGVADTGENLSPMLASPLISMSI